MIKRNQIEPIIAFPNVDINPTGENKLFVSDSYSSLYYADSYNNVIKLLSDGYTLLNGAVDGNIFSWDGYSERMYAGFKEPFNDGVLDSRWSVILGDPTDTVEETNRLSIITNTASETRIETVGVLPSLPMTIQWHIERTTDVNQHAGIRISDLGGSQFFSFGTGEGAGRFNYVLAGGAIVNYAISGGFTSGWIRLYLSTTFWRVDVAQKDFDDPILSDDDFDTVYAGKGFCVGAEKYYKLAVFLNLGGGSSTRQVYISNLSVRSG